jgi:hypothetical protein
MTIEEINLLLEEYRDAADKADRLSDKLDRNPLYTKEMVQKVDKARLELENKIAELKAKRKELQKIHDIACDGWKQRIANIAKDQPFGDIKLSQAKVDKMFKAATPKQLPVLEKIFDKRVTLDMDAILRQIEVRKNWNLAGVSFFLPYDYTWKIVSDDIGVSCLVPTRK